MFNYYELEKLTTLHQQELRAEVTAISAVAHMRLPQGPVRRVLATTLAFLANRVDPAVWEGPITKLQISASKAA